MAPRAEISPSLGWNSLLNFNGAVLAEIVVKWLQEKLNQTLTCRAELAGWGGKQIFFIYSVYCNSLPVVSFLFEFFELISLMIIIYL